MILDTTKLIEYLDARVDPELSKLVRARLALPEYENREQAQRALREAVFLIERESALELKVLTMRSLEYGATLSPEQEEDLLRRLFL